MQEQASGKRQPVHAAKTPPRVKASSYPEPFASQMAGRIKRPLGDWFGLKNFGVNLTQLEPGAVSALRHSHSLQDEFVYVLRGELVLHTDEGRQLLSEGMCVGFPAGSGNGHRLINASAAEAVYLEIGDRSAGDQAHYPDDDLVAQLIEGRWIYRHKDGTPY